VLVFSSTKVLLGGFLGDDVFADLENLLGAKETADVVGSVKTCRQSHCEAVQVVVEVLAVVVVAGNQRR